MTSRNWVKRQPKKGTSPRTSTQVIAKHETALLVDQ